MLLSLEETFSSDNNDIFIFIPQDMGCIRVHGDMNTENELEKCKQEKKVIIIINNKKNGKE